MLLLDGSSGSIFFLMSLKRRVYYLFSLRHENHLVTVRKRSCFGLKYLLLSHKHTWKMSRGLLERTNVEMLNVALDVIYKCQYGSYDTSKFEYIPHLQKC